MTSENATPPILLVEDDPLLGVTMRRYLERWSEDVRLADSCEEAVAAWSDLPAGVVLMDYRLPDGFGTDVIALMRSRGRRDPVICMTGEAETITAEMQAGLGIRRVLAKPVMLDALRPELDPLMGGGGGVPVPAVSERPAGRCGKYRWLRWRGQMTGPRVARLCRAAREELWVALDVSRVGEADSAAWRGICAWSGWLSSRGGRLCLIAPDPAQRQRLEAETNELVDVLGSTELLETQSTRLTGRAERRQLMGLIATFGPRRKDDA